MIDRRRFLGALSGGLFAAPLAAEAQRAGKLARIGILWAYSPSIASLFADAFRQGLRGLGYVEGQNIALEDQGNVWKCVEGGQPRVSEPKWILMKYERQR